MVGGIFSDSGKRKMMAFSRFSALREVAENATSPCVKDEVVVATKSPRLCCAQPVLLKRYNRYKLNDIYRSLPIGGQTLSSILTADHPRPVRCARSGQRRSGAGHA